MEVIAKRFVLCALMWMISAGDDLCCYPKQYQTSLVVRETHANDHIFTTTTDYEPYMVVDFNSKRKAVRELIRTDPGNVLVNRTTILDYGKGVGYIIYGGPKPNCTKIRLSGHMERECLPTSEKFVRRITLGYGMESTGCDVYYTYLPFFQWHIHKALSQNVAYGCFPVAADFKIMNGKSVNGAIDMMFFDFTPYTRDWSVFDIPDICHNVTTDDRVALSGVAKYALGMLTDWPE